VAGAPPQGTARDGYRGAPPKEVGAGTPEGGRRRGPAAL